MEEKIRNIRVSLDSVFTLAGMLQKSREIASAITSFEVSKMMLGKVLSTLGTPNPYPESKNPASPKIEPTAEKSAPMNWGEELDHTARVKHLRSLADKICSEIAEVVEKEGAQSDPHWTRTVFAEDAYLECQKGMMWLGMELGRIRDQK